MMVYLTCDGDCNDFDPTVLVTDFDGDGYSCLVGLQ